MTSRNRQKPAGRNRAKFSLIYRVLIHIVIRHRFANAKRARSARLPRSCLTGNHLFDAILEVISTQHQFLIGRIADRVHHARFEVCAKTLL